MLIPVLWNIFTSTCTKNTLRERWYFQCQQVEFRRKKMQYFFSKILWKIAGKAVLDDLNCNFLCLPIWMTVEKWNCLIMITTGIQNAISNAVSYTCTAYVDDHDTIENIRQLQLLSDQYLPHLFFFVHDKCYLLINVLFLIKQSTIHFRWIILKI